MTAQHEIIAALEAEKTAYQFGIPVQRIVEEGSRVDKKSLKKAVIVLANINASAAFDWSSSNGVGLQRIIEGGLKLTRSDVAVLGQEEIESAVSLYDFKLLIIFGTASLKLAKGGFERIDCPPLEEVLAEVSHKRRLWNEIKEYQDKHHI